MKKFFIVLFVSSVYLFLLNISHVFGECSKEKANELLKAVSKFYISQEANINIYEVTELKDLGLCEVVFSIVSNATSNASQSVLKNIFYFKDSYLFFGELKKVEENKISELTREKFNALNKEYFEHIQKQVAKAQVSSVEREKLKEEVLKAFDDIKKKADMKFGSDGNIKTETITFVDPYCPHCKNMMQVLLGKAKEGKIKAYFVYLPLGEESKKIAASIICDKKTDTERLKAFADKYVSKTKICSAGEKKVEENVALFLKFKGTRVPLTFLKKESQLEIIEGAVSENVFESYLK